jgi:predicted dehydrogenase
MKSLNRRTFLKRAAGALGTFTILPPHLWANPPSGKIRLGIIGVGGKGRNNSAYKHPQVEVAGLCDVDFIHSKMEQKLLEFPGARTFRDYREMFAQIGGQLDAVVVSTPDHTHHPATLMAMNLGKHAYTEKPLTHNIAEARELKKVAAEKKLVTQMGIQNHAALAYRMASKYLRDGVLGKVHKVLVWSDKSWGYEGPPYTGEDPVPANLDWNLWLGTAPVRPYLTKTYHPVQWRRYYDFGCGTLGDMGAHIFDTPYHALELGLPQWVRATCNPSNGLGYPSASKVEFGFAPTPRTSKDLVWSWYDGASSPPKDDPDCQLPDMELPKQGAIIVGENGKMCLPHTEAPRIYPVEIQRALPPHDLPKAVDHAHQWVGAILGTATPAASFDYAATLTETILLGTIGCRFPGKKLEWDAANARFPNLPEADAYVKRKNRDMDKNKAVYQTGPADIPKPEKEKKE